MRVVNFKKYTNFLTYEFKVIAIVRILSATLQLFYLKLYTQNLSNNNLGNFALWISVSYILNAAIFVPLDYYQQSRIYPFKASGKSLISFVFFNFKIFCIVIFLTIIVFIGLYKFNITEKYFFILSVFTAIGLYLTTSLKNVLNNSEFKITASLMQPIEVFLKIIIFYILIINVEASSISLMLSQALSFFIVILLLILVSRKYRIFNSGLYTRLNMREILIFCYPISIGAILNLAQLQGYRMFLVPLGYENIVGIYFGITQVGIAIMGLLSIIYFSIYSPIIYKSNGEYIWKFIKNALILILFTLAVTMLTSYWLILLLTKEEFAKIGRAHV